ncbi:MAG TPA: biotin--[acetyl-CoA-carboxylase] ligase [Ramlibacter sp.]|uniref:biotin--[acetyl-CoA-carboxylase] ligase n=1 Tax=Ramlibacter sp. TaxID=1917967 RepID=UPI002CA2BEDB|nr:biotin--[acetyl-CoA-carboxylase] ligase [Ramlibacter sp.]HVZ47029.1 biotin--[acetyl-CoA-carboxylase] ligase [Ramlibacter sp.]
MADTSTAEALRQAVAPLIPGFRVEVVPEVDSTNSELMRRARAVAAEPLLFVAEHQRAGRGRLGRGWVSREGESLTFSLGVPLAPADWSGLSLAVGAAIAESLHPAIQLKWPNDLWFDGRKLAGILVETAAPGDASSPAPRYAVIGVGINILPRPEAGLATPPAALQEPIPGITAAEALKRIALPLVEAVKAFETYGFAPFQSRFNARDALRDRPVVLSDGTTGTAHGVGESGGLLVHTAEGMRVVTSSEVSVRPGA